MNQQVFYSISDLAEKVGVPRTTITDWLTKYERFIEMQTQGRRRFYTARSLEVLCKIAEMRNSGRSLADIDAALEQFFAIHPTVETASNTENAESQATGAGNTDTGANEDASEGNSYTLVKQNNDAVTELVNAKFADLCNSLNEVNHRAATSAKQLKFMLAFSVMIIVILSGAVILLYLSNEAAKHTREANQQANLRKFAELTGESAQLGQGISGVASGVSTLDKNIQQVNSGVSSVNQNLQQVNTGVNGLSKELEQLQAGLTAQRQEFDKAIEAQKKAFEQQLLSEKEKYELQLTLEKEVIAAERLDLLKERESLAEASKNKTSQDAERIAELKRLQDELNEKKETIRKLETTNSELAANSSKVTQLTNENKRLKEDLGKSESALQLAQKNAVQAQSQLAQARKDAEQAKKDAEEQIKKASEAKSAGQASPEATP